MTRSVKDQLGRIVHVPEVPRRIVSLVPSQTELLYTLGLSTEVVGITKFCIHPTEWWQTKLRVGGTKQVNYQTIEEVQPDLIIGNKEENQRTDIENLSARWPTWVSDVRTLPQALEMIRLVGDLVGRKQTAMSLAQSIEESIDSWPVANNTRVAYLIWRNPWMGVGADTFIHAVLSRLGMVNVLAEKGRYPTLTAEDLQSADPKEVWLSSEPYPFKQQHIVECQQVLPQAKIRLVDGEMFSWYGSRMVQMAAYFHALMQDLQ